MTSGQLFVSWGDGKWGLWADMPTTVHAWDLLALGFLRTSEQRRGLTEATVGIVPTDGSVGNDAVGSEATLGSVGNWNCSIQQTANIRHHARVLAGLLQT